MGGDIRAAIFLHRVQPLVGSLRLRFRPRNQIKTMEFMADNGLAEADIFDMVANLHADNYYNGPSDERDPKQPPGQIMVFFYDWNKIRLYIKLKLITNGLVELADIMSAHPEGMHDK